MKKLLSMLLIGLMVSITIISCKDDFNEEEFLKLQSELKLKQDSINRARNKAAVDFETARAAAEYIAAANAAGDLLAVTLFVRENGLPVPGVTVNLTSSTKAVNTSGRTDAVQTGTTDAAGSVVFDRVTIGSGTITFSKTGYIGSNAIFDFGTPAAPVTINVPNPITGQNVPKYVTPQKRFEEAIFPMISTTGTTATATIRGRVTIENDLTNLTPEVPAGVVIRANLNALVTQLGNPTSIGASPFTSYTFEDNSTLGVATVAANGDYTMTVPATAAGLNIGLIVPNIEGTARMAVNGYDNGTGTAVTLVNGPEYRDVPTSWGPQAINPLLTNIPAVGGARITFPAAPAAGTGLAFDLVEVPRSLETGNVSSASNQQLTSTIFKISDRGDYAAGAAPTIAVTGGGGSGITALANIRSYISAITVTTPGTGYTGNLFINFVTTNGAGVDAVQNSIAIPNTGGGLPATINLSQFSGTSGFAANNQLNLGNDISGLKVTVTGTAGTGAVVSATFKTEVQSVQITNGGSGYTSRPTFTFSGGGLTAGDTKHADLDVVDFGVQWTINPNNTASVGYSVLPADFTVSYPSTPLNPSTFTSTLVNLFSLSGINEQNNVSVRSQLTVAGGAVVKRNAAQALRTGPFSSVRPTVVITPETPTNAAATGVTINTLGAVTGITGINAGNGYSTNFTGTIVPAITGAPGTGAAVTLTNLFDSANSEWNWNSSFTINNGGSGYLINLNQRGFQAGAFPPATINGVQAGKSYTQDIAYGTGNRKVAVN